MRRVLLGIILAALFAFVGCESAQAAVNKKVETKLDPVANVAEKVERIDVAKKATDEMLVVKKDVEEIAMVDRQAAQVMTSNPAMNQSVTKKKVSKDAATVEARLNACSATAVVLNIADKSAKNASRDYGANAEHVIIEVKIDGNQAIASTKWRTPPKTGDVNFSAKMVDMKLVA